MCDVGETTSLFSSSKRLPRYGTTSDVTIKPDFKFIKHKIDPSDTLPGLALKYGTTVMEIKRVNKLWSSDNISIYETLNIPVESSHQSNTPNGYHDEVYRRKSSYSNDSHISANELLQKIDSTLKSYGKYKRFEENDSKLTNGAQMSSTKEIDKQEDD